MKYIIKNMKNAGLALFASMAMVSCSDFLDVLPLNDIVLENYWTEKSDVESVLTSCYASLEAKDCINRMAVWGEFRSDNIIIGNNVPNDIRQILEENLLQSNGYTTWKCFYQVINECNTVIHYAPQVQKIDPNFSDSELRATVAEATALRSLCYFYLIRAFRDVPYTTEPSIDDTQNYRIPATSFDEILATIINDLEAIQNDAVKKYAAELNNTSRITRIGIWAILADMYLWKEDYDNCIKYCDKIIAGKIEEYEELKEESPTIVYNIELFNDYYPLQPGARLSSTVAGYAYTQIFGIGNSFESLFELNFRESQSVVNEFVQKFYLSERGNTKGHVKPADFLVSDPVQSNTLFKKTDNRYFENMYSGAIVKYTSENVNVDNIDSKATYSASYSYRSTNYANWILYRLSDVMLMKAEALIQKAGDFIVDEGDGKEENLAQTRSEEPQTEQEKMFRDAFSLISVIYNRSNNITDDKKVTNAADTLLYATYGGSKHTMEKLLLQERQRELMFEGKRWFDLVRFARREGNTATLSEAAVMKQLKNASAIKIKLGAPDYIYFPYNEGELKVNPHLVQNPAFANDNSSALQ